MRGNDLAQRIIEHYIDKSEKITFTPVDLKLSVLISVGEDTDRSESKEIKRNSNHFHSYEVCNFTLERSASVMLRHEASPLLKHTLYENK